MRVLETQLAPRRRPAAGARRWSRAAALSVGVHALGLAVLWAGAALRPGAAGDLSMPPLFPDAVEAATDVDLASAEELLAAAASLPAVEAARPPEQPGDQTTPPRSPRPQASDGTTDRQASAPATDRGAGAGRLVDQPAWRRDGSTLHERVDDGAEHDRPSHARTAREAASAQAVRREPVTGTGDSVRQQHAQTALLAARYAVTDPAADGIGGETREDGARVIVPATAAALPVAARTVLAAADGPLDAEAGVRSYDVDRRSLNGTTTDDRVTRAASTEIHPSITDLTLAAVSGNTREGHGASDTPGAVVRPTAGTAPSTSGARATTEGTDDAAATRARVYDRYHQEIRARVDRALVWPRALAIRLEQGETVLRFVVRPDGGLADVQVTKSSGFVEFDQAAVDAVRKASPFPPMSKQARPGSLTVNMPVSFSNPVVR